MSETRTMRPAPAPGALVRAWLDALAARHGGYVTLAARVGLGRAHAHRLARGSVPQPTTLGRLLRFADADVRTARAILGDARCARSVAQQGRQRPNAGSRHAPATVAA